mmetsp:Transcript_33032/g.51499  ORF Transcript_33032/g.51499 Transcript_33032/m.51499 type:complete len:186 (-) Transcript_33032:1519-2076(-)
MKSFTSFGRSVLWRSGLDGLLNGRRAVVSLHAPRQASALIPVPASDTLSAAPSFRGIQTAAAQKELDDTVLSKLEAALGPSRVNLSMAMREQYGRDASYHTDVAALSPEKVLNLRFQPQPSCPSHRSMDFFRLRLSFFPRVLRRWRRLSRSVTTFLCPLSPQGLALLWRDSWQLCKAEWPSISRT